MVLNKINLKIKFNQIIVSFLINHHQIKLNNKNKINKVVLISHLETLIKIKIMQIQISKMDKQDKVVSFQI